MGWPYFQYPYPAHIPWTLIWRPWEFVCSKCSMTNLNTPTLMVFKKSKQTWTLTVSKKSKQDGAVSIFISNKWLFSSSIYCFSSIFSFPMWKRKRKCSWKTSFSPPLVKQHNPSVTFHDAWKKSPGKQRYEQRFL